MFNHSHRLFFWANEMGLQAGEKSDVELLFIWAAFHDFGMLKRFSSATDRIEVDGTNAVRQFLMAHKLPEAHIETALGSRCSAHDRGRYSVHAPLTSSALLGCRS